MRKANPIDIFNFIENSSRRHAEEIIKGLEKEFIFNNPMNHAQLQDIVKTTLRVVWRIEP